jgi:hypothetical protein
MSDSSNGESSESTITLTNYEGISDDWEQPFNSGYLTDYLNTTTTEEILWESNPSKPSILSPKGHKATQMYLVSGLKS